MLREQSLRNKFFCGIACFANRKTKTEVSIVCFLMEATKKQRKTCFKNLFREVFDVSQTENKNWDIENCVWKPNNPNFCSRKTCFEKVKNFQLFQTSFPRTKIRVIRLPYTIFD